MGVVATKSRADPIRPEGDPPRHLVFTRGRTSLVRGAVGQRGGQQPLFVSVRSVGRKMGTARGTTADPSGWSRGRDPRPRPRARSSRNSSCGIIRLGSSPSTSTWASSCSAASISTTPPRATRRAARANRAAGEHDKPAHREPLRGLIHKLQGKLARVSQKDFTMQCSGRTSSP